ncbi:MAG: hypothetical protein EZS28_017293 [Streblomastix strix]|uniref:Uncharacterized protein n=1 Tax=Streblomastix strix TaxID=222440 RepID=A0A5J4VX23_9EUKA|nr:MAG: hypothetical protein EZS28_017293 [Streblomastix strix]
MASFNFFQKKKQVEQARVGCFMQIHVLFPFIEISDSHLQAKTENLIEPNCRTDLCDLCHDADHIFLIMQRYGFEFQQLKQVQQEKLIKWKKHIDHADHQSEVEQQEILINLKPEECVIRVQYKENIELPKPCDSSSSAHRLRGYIGKAFAPV